MKRTKVREYPGARCYYLRDPATGNRLATVMLARTGDGRWCRGVSILCCEKGHHDEYNANKGRVLAWHRLMMALHSGKCQLPVGAMGRYSVSRFFSLTQDMILHKSGYDIVLTPKEEEMVNDEKAQA
jgi:hypothetical protein